MYANEEGIIMYTKQISSRMKHGRKVEEFVTINLIDGELEFIYKMLSDRDCSRTEFYTVEDIITWKKIISSIEQIIIEDPKKFGGELVDCDEEDEDWIDLAWDEYEEATYVDWESFLLEE